MTGEGQEGSGIAARIVRGYEARLAMHGDTHLGVGWPRAEDVATRHRVMLDVLPPSPDRTEPVTLLDFGCGAAHLLDHLNVEPRPGLRYTGLDYSSRFIRLAREKHRDVPFLHLDVLADDVELPSFDYVVMNGVLTVKGTITHHQMWSYAQRLLRRCFSMARKGLAFNVMTSHLDWERDDLFHVPFDEMAGFVRNNLSHHFAFRQDYGLFEYTTYVYRGARMGER